MKHKFTHTGVIRGCDNRTREDFRRRVNLRETKNYWITEHGTKYSKTTGYMPGSWPMYHLDINHLITIEELNRLREEAKKAKEGLPVS